MTANGCVEWFDSRKGFGFINVLDGEYKDTQIFCHQSNIKSNNFRTLFPGEYVSFEINKDPQKTENNISCRNLTGFNGGPILTDNKTHTIRAYTKREPDVTQEEL